MKAQNISRAFFHKESITLLHKLNYSMF